MDNIQYITLDLMDNKTYDYIYTKQYDVGRTVIFSITKDGSPVNLSGLSCIFSMTKPDGNVILMSSTDDEITIDYPANTITLTLTDQITVLYGKLPYQISLLDGEKVVSTITGHIFCEKAAIQREDMESISDGSIIDDLAVVAEAIKDGTIHSGDIVSVSATVQSGTKIAEVTVNDVQTDLYAPSVDVEDVYVNGSSVLDNNNIAQIKTHKSLSLGQYNQLSNAEKNNGTIYFVESSNANYTFVESQDGKCVVRIDNTTHETLWFWRGYNFTEGDMPIPAELSGYAPNSSSPIYTSNYPGGRSIQDGWVGFYNNQMRCWIQDLSLTGGGIQYGVLDVNGVNQQINPYTDPYDVGGSFEIYYMGHRYSENEIGINDLTDVTITSPSNGQILRYDSTSGTWKNAQTISYTNIENDTPGGRPFLFRSTDTTLGYDPSVSWDAYYFKLRVGSGIGDTTIEINGGTEWVDNSMFITSEDIILGGDNGYWEDDHSGHKFLKDAIRSISAPRSLSSLSDVDPTNITGGSLLYYDDSDNMWKSTIDATSQLGLSFDPNYMYLTGYVRDGFTMRLGNNDIVINGYWNESGDQGANDYSSLNYAIIDLYSRSAAHDSVSSLTDTTISNPTDGQVLKYNSTTNKWINSSDIIASSASSLDTGYFEIIEDNCYLNDAADLFIGDDGYWDSNVSEPQYHGLRDAVSALFDAVESGGESGYYTTALNTGYVAIDGDENIGVCLRNGGDVMLMDEDDAWDADSGYYNSLREAIRTLYEKVADLEAIVNPQN